MDGVKNDLIHIESDEQMLEVLNSLANLLSEIVKFGAKILYWDMDRPKGNDEDIPPILFLRNFLEELDAIAILVRNSSIEPCKNLLRTSLENIFYLLFLLEKDTKNRSLSFIVWNAISNHKLLSKADATSTEFQNLLKKYQTDKFLSSATPLEIKNAIHLKDQIDKLFLKLEYVTIKQEYENTKARLKIKNPAWYSLFGGPRNIYELAEHLEMPVFYDVLYRGWSDSVHGTNIIQGKLIADDSGQPLILPIRVPDEAQSITQHCYNLSMAVFPTYIVKKVPHKRSEMLAWMESIKSLKMVLTTNFKNFTY